MVGRLLIDSVLSNCSISSAGPTVTAEARAGTTRATFVSAMRAAV